MKFLTIAFFCLMTTSLLAQTKQQLTVDSVFQRVKQAFNSRQADTIYAMTGEKFRKEISAEKFLYIAQKQLFPMGAIKDWSLISFQNNSLATYKIVMNAETMQLLITLDDQNKLELFLFQPYQKPVADKIEQVKTTNILRSALDKKIDTAARAYIQKENTVGLSIGVLNSNGIATYNYGETERGNDKLPNANSVFEIGSITKTFTATLLAYYAYEGKVKLSDPITKFLPDSVAANPELKGITLEMLSNHTSGLPRLPENFEVHLVNPADPYKEYTKKIMYADLKSTKLDNPPGTQYGYSNFAVGLLGVILEQVSGKSYEQMIEDVITRPLEMENTAAYISIGIRQRLVTVYDEGGNATPVWNFAAMAAAGALKSTVNDLMKYVQANMAGGVTPLHNAIVATHHLTFQKDVRIGLAWHVIRLNGIDYLFHNGGTGGSSSYLAFNTEKHIGVVVLSNAVASVDDLGQRLLNILAE